jgi:hypothetical protein
VAALSLSAELREKIYEVVPVRIASVPHLGTESGDWGKVIMKKTRKGKNVNRFAATTLRPGGAEVYLSTLKQIFAA